MDAARAKMGPIIRIVEVYFCLVILTILGYALAMPAGDFVYDITLVRIVVVMTAAVRSIWLIERRADTTRQFVVISSIVVVVLSLLDMFFGGEYERIAAVVTWPQLIAGGILYFSGALATIVYFAFSPHAKEVFVEPLEKAERLARKEDEEIYPRAFTWPWFRNLVIYYCVFSIVGHWAEIGFCWLIVLGVVMGDYDFSHAQLWDWWLCPYPAEGLAVVLIVILLFPIKEWLLKKFNGRVLPALAVSFLVNMLVCASIDFTTGITANWDYHLWDFRGLPFNFMGQVLLQNTLAYSLAATVIVWVIYPLLAKLLHRAPQSIVNGLFFGLVGFYAFIEVLYYVHIGPGGLMFG